MSKYLHAVFIACTFLAVLAGMGWAQQPKSRSMLRLHPGVAWQVEMLAASDRLFASNNTGEAAAGQVELTETNSIGRDHRRQAIIHPDGKTEVRYITANFLLTEQSDGTFTLQTTGEDEESNLPRLRPDRLLEFAWTEGLKPVATMQVDGVECDIYAIAHDRTPVLPAEARVGEIRYLAAIGREDHFPRRLETPAKVLRFVPLPRVQPAGLPASAQKAVEEYLEKVRKQVQRHALPR